MAPTQLPVTRSEQGQGRREGEERTRLTLGSKLIIGEEHLAFAGQSHRFSLSSFSSATRWLWLQPNLLNPCLNSLVNLPMGKSSVLVKIFNLRNFKAIRDNVHPSPCSFLLANAAGISALTFNFHLCIFHSHELELFSVLLSKPASPLGAYSIIVHLVTQA